MLACCFNSNRSGCLQASLEAQKQEHEGAVAEWERSHLDAVDSADKWKAWADELAATRDALQDELGQAQQQLQVSFHLKSGPVRGCQALWACAAMQAWVTSATLSRLMFREIGPLGKYVVCLFGEGSL